MRMPAAARKPLEEVQNAMGSRNTAPMHPRMITSASRIRLGE